MDTPRANKNGSLSELAEGLARHFGEQRDRACGCMGLSCQDLGCALWWKFFLTQHTAEEIHEMVNNYKKMS